MSRNGPNKVAHYARRKMEQVSQERFSGQGAREQAEAAMEAAKREGVQVRMTRYKYGSRTSPSFGYTVTAYRAN